jgi:AcrR family transcriptional regulator
MVDPQNSEPRRSRREIPAKPALTREGVVAAALAVLNAEGLAKVTMRRVAAELDTGHASLYVYVRDTRDLHAQVLDALLAPVVNRPSDPAEVDWKDELVAVLRDYYRLLAAHTELARAAITGAPNGPNYLGLIERLLALMSRGGIAAPASAWAVDLLLLYPTALAVEHPLDQDEQGDDGKPWRTEQDLTGLPHLAALSAELLSGSPEERFRWSVDVILAGAAATAVGSPVGGP